MRKTEIFSSIGAFMERTDRSLNGVSSEFVAQHPNWEEMNATNNGCWNCEDCVNCANCERCIRCSYCFACEDCYDCARCVDSYCCYHCVRCVDGNESRGCTDCYHAVCCTDCTNCHGCWNLTGKQRISFNKKPAAPVPVIPSIHQTVYNAAKKPDALNMDTWHYCATTHCRGGWVVNLAGEKGLALENETSTEFAALQIYHVSSPSIPVYCPDFFVSDEAALESMKQAAALEFKQESLGPLA